MTAGDVPAVAAIVKDAVDTLLGPHSQGDARLEVRIDDTLRAAVAPDGPAPMTTASWIAGFIAAAR